MRFLDIGIGDRVPDSKTIWLFREKLKEAGIFDELFAQFDVFLNENGFAARRVQIIDASIVSVPKQRNSREENEAIKSGGKICGWSEAKRRQKDTDARWTKKNGKSYYGYKNHVSIDVEHKLIRGHKVTDASVHDSQVMLDVLDEYNRSGAVWADSAYYSRSLLFYLHMHVIGSIFSARGAGGSP